MRTEGIKPNLSEQNKARNMFVKDEIFSQIESGQKTCELRLAYDSFLRIKPGQILEFKAANKKSLRARVVGSRKYKTFESMLEKEDLSKIAPGISKDQAVLDCQRLFDKKYATELGLVVIEFKKI